MQIEDKLINLAPGHRSDGGNQDRGGSSSKYGDLTITAALVSIFDQPPAEFLKSSRKGCPFWL
jgi:hypothetical protein